MDRKLVLVTNGSSWFVAHSELSHIEALKIAEQVVEAFNKGLDVFANPDLIVKPAEVPKPEDVKQGEPVKE